VPRGAQKLPKHSTRIRKPLGLLATSDAGRECWAASTGYATNCERQQRREREDTRYHRGSTYSSKSYDLRRLFSSFVTSLL